MQISIPAVTPPSRTPARPLSHKTYKPSSNLNGSHCQSSPKAKPSQIKNRLLEYDRNQQYSVTAITDGSGAISERYAYTAYGRPTITDASATVRTTSAVSNRYAYTGREWGDTLALYYYRERIYDSTSGRFLSKDSYGFIDSKNAFQYAKSMPTIQVDPLGNVSSTVDDQIPLKHDCGSFAMSWKATPESDERYVVQKLCIRTSSIECTRGDCCKGRDRVIPCEICFYELLVDMSDVRYRVLSNNSDEREKQ